MQKVISEGKVTLTGALLQIRCKGSGAKIFYLHF